MVPALKCAYRAKIVRPNEAEMEYVYKFLEDYYVEDLETLLNDVDLIDKDEFLKK